MKYPSDMKVNDLISEIDNEAQKVREAQTALARAKYALVEKLVNDQAYDCLTVNIQRARRFYR